MDIQQNIPLAPLTTFKIGGPAKYFCKVKSLEDLKEALLWVEEKKLPYFILGGGSNLLISDEGFSGLVIKNEISNIILENNIVKSGSGTPLVNLIAFTTEHGLEGLQKLTGIYGTVGGALFGNAGAYGQTISDYLTEVVFLNNMELETWDKEKCQFGYRDSVFKKNSYIILEACFKLPQGDTQILQKEIAELVTQRQAKFPSTLKCPGSFLKNIPVENISADPANAGLKLILQDKIVHGKVPAAVLLDLVGAKGRKIGEIKVTDYHANLIINESHGKAQDVWQLAHDLVQAVKEKFAITLEPEVQFINLPPL